MAASLRPEFKQTQRGIASFFKPKAAAAGSTTSEKEKRKAEEDLVKEGAADG
jgi:hypothetical protein